jgi:hypothetical protein
MPSELEALIQQYRELRAEGSSTTLLEAANLVCQIWALVKPELRYAGKNHLRASDYFTKELNPEYAGAKVEVMLAILATGDARLFEAIDRKKYTIYQARRLMGEAKKRAEKQGISYALALTEVMEKEDKPGTIEPTSVTPLPEELGTLAQTVSSSRGFRRRLLELTSYYVEAALVGVDEAERRRLSLEFSHDVRIAYEELRRRISVLRADRKKAERIPMSAVVAACHVLGIKAPASGLLPDMTNARDTFKRLMSQLHPDRRQGNHDPKIVEQYVAVVEAWQTLQDYERQVKP